MTTALMIACVFIITAAAIYFTMRQLLAKPLEKLANSFQTISSSSFNNNPLPLHEDNEIGVMAKAFNIVLKNACDKTNEMAEEIIERSKVEKALKKSETQFKQMAEHIDEVLWLCSADGMEMHYVSPAYEEIYGRSCHEFYKDPHVWLNDIHEKDRARVIKNFAENGIKGKNFSSTFRICRPDGETRTVCDTGFPIFDDNGNLYRIAGTVRDITKQKKSDEKLAKLRLLYEYILHSAGEGIYGLDPDGNTTFVNPAAANMLGYDTHELIGKSQHDFVHHSKLNGTPYLLEECPISMALHDGQIHKVDDEVFWRKDKSSFPVEYVSTPIRDTKNKG